jgi:hypothetical protein
MRSPLKLRCNQTGSSLYNLCGIVYQPKFKRMNLVDTYMNALTKCQGIYCLKSSEALFVNMYPLALHMVIPEKKFHFNQIPHIPADCNKTAIPHLPFNWHLFGGLLTRNAERDVFERFCT